MMIEIAQALATELATIPGVQQSAFMLANPTPPAMEVTPGPPQVMRREPFIDYDQTFSRGSDTLLWTVRGLVALTTDIGAQKLLLAFADPTGTKSVKAALEANPTLGGVISDLRVTRCYAPITFQREGSTSALLGAEWAVEMYASGT
jgi:hypothetical protein